MPPPQSINGRSASAIIAAAEGTRLFRSGEGLSSTERDEYGGYLTGGDLDLHFGLGEAAVVDEVEVLWANGSVSSWSGVGVDQVLVLEP